MIDHGDPFTRQVLEVWTHFRKSPLSRVQAATPGLSGAWVARCWDHSLAWALKCWPASTSRTRISEIHKFQIAAAQQLSFVPCPQLNGDGDSVTAVRGRLFDLCDWMPGQTYVPQALAADEVKLASGLTRLAAVERGAAAIAELHAFSDRFHDERDSQHAVAPAVSTRLERLQELQVQLPLSFASAVARGGQIAWGAKFLQERWQSLLAQARSALLSWVQVEVPIQWVLRDIHREHMLFANGQVTGLVDFDALRPDTVSADMARWVGSFVDPETEMDRLWKAAWDGYSSVRSISPCEQELASAIERASWFVHLANWVVWSGDETVLPPGGLRTAHDRISVLMRIRARFCH